MWMMGYNDISGELNFRDSFNGRKLRPLIPRPAAAANNTTCFLTNTTTNSPLLSQIYGTDHLVAINHHLDRNWEHDLGSQRVNVVSSSSRWNPTPEQLQALEELYRQGTRTPSADQIQHITAQLRRYGKIEGKNVFYWFQNHKARERQKRRRQLIDDHHEYDDQYRPQEDIVITESKDSEANRTDFEVEETRKNWGPVSTNGSTFLYNAAEETDSTKRAAECRTCCGWVQFDQGELMEERRNLLERNDTWQLMQFSSCSPPTHLLNTITTNATTTTTDTTISSNTTTLETASTMDPKPRKSSQHLGHHQSTLQLFPLRSGYEENENIADNEAERLVGDSDTNFAPQKFFEFLPLKEC